MYIFTNEEYKKLFEAIEQRDIVSQFFYMYSAHFRKVKENEKIRERVNEKRKTNKNYGRPKPKNK